MLLVKSSSNLRTDSIIRGETGTPMVYIPKRHLMVATYGHVGISHMRAHTHTQTEKY